MLHINKTPHIIALSIALIAILGFLAYGNSLKGEFLYDDEYLVKSNTYITDWSNTGRIFTEYIGAGGGIDFRFYRPVQILTYLVDYSLWKLDARGYHLTNILLHIGAAVCVFLFFIIIGAGWPSSFTGAVLFLLHPIHTEAVSYISGRADCLALIFIILALIFYIRAVRTDKPFFYIVMFLGYLLALLSKESALVFPALALIYHYALREKLKIKPFFCILLATILYAGLRLSVLQGSPIKIAPQPFFERLPGFFAAITSYTKLLLAPFGLHMEYGIKTFRFTDPQSILGIAIFVSAIAYAVRIRKTNGLISLGLLWIFVAILPVSNVIYPVNAYMAEHWLYVPSVGFFLSLAIFLQYIRKRFAIFFMVVILALPVFYIYLTVKQNGYWQDPMTFFKRTLQYSPYSYRVYNGMGVKYDEAGDKDMALAAYKRSIELNPQNAFALNNLGQLYISMGRNEEAEAVIRKAMDIEPGSAFMPNSMGKLYSAMGKYEEAIRYFKKAIELNPGYSVAYNNRGGIYCLLGRYGEAVEFLNKAIKINPSSAGPYYYNLGVAYSGMNKPDDAIAAYEKAVSFDQKDPDTHYNLAVLYYRSNRMDKASRHFGIAAGLGRRLEAGMLVALK